MVDWDRLLTLAGRAGATQAEVYHERTVQTQVRVFRGRIESVRTIDSEGFGLRVLVGHRVGYAYGSPVHGADLEAMAHSAVAAARVAAPDPSFGLAEAGWHYREPGDRGAARIPLERKVELALEAERSTRAVSSRIVGTDDVEYLDFDREIHIRNTHGVDVAAAHSQYRMFVTAVAEERGESQSGLGVAYGPGGSPGDPGPVGEEAARRALALLGARPRPTTEVPVVFDPLVGAGLIRLLNRTVSAESVQRGRSRWADRLSERVASPLVTLVDDGTLEGGPVRAPFDGEGTPARRTVLVSDGLLQGFLYTAEAARRVGAQPTGNSHRHNFREAPEYAVTNFYLKPGAYSADEIISVTAEGLYVQEVQGLHMANKVSGHFSLGVTGRWIRAGALAEPVRNMTVAGNLLDLLFRVDMVGRDLRFFPDNTLSRSCAGGPTFRVSSLVVSGK